LTDGDRPAFTSIIEVFPPLFSTSEDVEPIIGLRQKTRDIVERVRRIKHLADSFLLADLRDSTRMKLPTVLCASILREKAGVDAIPVITARDSNRAAVVSSLLSAYSLGLTSIMLVWGDRYDGGGPKNVYDFRSLSEVIGLARKLAERCGDRCRLLAPVDLPTLGTKTGLELARKRLASGADVLLAQPPTTDSYSTLHDHARLIKDSGLDGRVLLNVFPFRDAKDIENCRTKFGWKLPRRLDAVSRGGEKALLLEAKKVADAIERMGLPGLYVTTRGRPEVARFILD
jgi:5,10-methylenetetrahydrofolate reductase